MVKGRFARDHGHFAGYMPFTLACPQDTRPIVGFHRLSDIGSIEGDPQKYESPVDHLGLLGALQAAQGAANAPCKVDVMVVAFSR